MSHMNNKLVIALLTLSTSGMLAPGNKPPKPPKPKPEPQPQDYAYGYAAKQVKDSVDTLDQMFTGKRAEEFTNGLVLGAFTGLGAAAKMGAVGTAEIVKDGAILAAAGTKAAAIAVATSPFTVPIAAGAAATGFTGYMGYVGWVCHRENGFNKCLSRHFDNENVNERGFPRRCDSPERRLRYWTNSVTETYIERFKVMKKRGLRPQGKWLGNDGIEDQKD